jgi:DNA repair photolyase
MEKAQSSPILKGRGAQSQPQNSFHSTSYACAHIEGVDEPFLQDPKTQWLNTYPKKVLSYNQSPDLPFEVSLNPYQGCEHGCVYCYARNSHEYWGFGPGVDFESKILIKQGLIETLEKEINRPNYVVKPIMLSGNTDCYQPVERKMQITRKVLATLWAYKHPVSIITKNSLILRDLDLLTSLASQNLVHVAVSIHTLDEKLRQKIEPRTSSTKTRLQVIEKLSQAGVPVHLMMAPLIPGLNSEAIPALIKAAAAAGARTASYGMLRLNGAIDELFKEWLDLHYPDRAQKVLHQISDSHGGSLNESRWGIRMKGEGNLVESIAQLFRLSVKKYFPAVKPPALRKDLFSPQRGRQLGLFDN